MKKRKKRRLFIKILLLIIFIAIIGYFGKKLYIKLNTNEVSVIDKIDNYNYSLEDRDTALYKEHFNSLKDILNQDDINYENYAKEEANLYIIDLFTLDNKVNKYDDGGIDFVYPDSLDNYKLNVSNTLYKYMEDNTNKKRKQDLPEVISINDDNVTSNTFTINDVKYDGYKVELSWDYVKDMGYDSKGIVTIIKKDNLLYVVQYESKKA
jgi:hypothetical protein